MSSIEPHDWKNGITKGARALLRLRYERGWSRADASIQTGLDRATVGRWERGTSTPSDKGIAQALVNAGVLPAELSDWDIDSPAVIAQFASSAMQAETAQAPEPAHITDEPPAWARDILHELHALRAELRDCKEIPQKDAS
jgi:transcriptional regulator with XRE-family HTH domain